MTSLLTYIHWAQKNGRKLKFHLTKDNLSHILVLREQKMYADHLALPEQEALKNFRFF